MRISRIWGCLSNVVDFSTRLVNHASFLEPPVKVEAFFEWHVGFLGKVIRRIMFDAVPSSELFSGSAAVTSVHELVLIS